MPTYEYKCLQCEHRFDHFQSMTDDPLSTCPECGGNVKRLIGAGAGIIFKGSGFYCTDYKNTGSEPSTSDTAGGNGDKSKADTGSEKTTTAVSDAPKKENAAS